MTSPSDHSSLHLQLLKVNNHIHHLNRLLSTTGNVDTALGTISYILALFRSVVLSDSTSSLSRLSTAIPPLNSLLSEARIILRLWGLLPIYAWGLATYRSPPADSILKLIAWTQVAACAVFQALENLAFLGDKGVIALNARTRGRYWIWSCRAWFVHVALELVRLGRELILKGKSSPQPRDQSANGITLPENEGTKTEVESMALKLARKEDWLRQLKINAAYAPMTIHYSLENGLLKESAVSALGLIASGISFMEAWKKAA